VAEDSRAARGVNESCTVVVLSAVTLAVRTEPKLRAKARQSAATEHVDDESVRSVWIGFDMLAFVIAEDGTNRRYRCHFQCFVVKAYVCIKVPRARLHIRTVRVSRWIFANVRRNTAVVN
jgi:hypothetical protein